MWTFYLQQKEINKFAILCVRACLLYHLGLPKITSMVISFAQKKKLVRIVDSVCNAGHSVQE